MMSTTAPLAAARAVIFDLDGTVVDSGTDIAAAANHVRREFDLAPVSPAVAIGYVGDGVAKLLRRILGHDAATGRTGAAGRPVTDAQLAAANRVFFEHYEQHCLDHTRLYPGIRDLLHSLRSRHVLLATNKPRAFTERILAGLDVAASFERIVAGDDTPAKKPDPAHLAACLEGIDVAPGDVVVVGDSPNDVLAARALGAVSVAVAYGLTPRERLAASGPDHLVDSVAALAALFGAMRR